MLPGDPLAPLDASSLRPRRRTSTNQADRQSVPVPPDGVPHLASPDALPPGSTMDPTVMGNEGPNTSYLKDLWHAVQNQEISGKEALIMGFAQRGMNTPYPNQAPGPNVPTSGDRSSAARGRGAASPGPVARTSRRSGPGRCRRLRIPRFLAACTCG